MLAETCLSRPFPCLRNGTMALCAPKVDGGAFLSVTLRFADHSPILTATRYFALAVSTT